MVNELVIIKDVYKNVFNKTISVLGKIVSESDIDNSILVETWEFLDKPIETRTFTKTNNSIFCTGIISKCFYEEIIRYNLTGNIKGLNPLESI